MWEPFWKFFAENDGSLPTLNLRLPSATALRDLYAELRSSSDLWAPDEATFWDAIEQRDVLIRDTPDPVAAALGDRTECWIFHGLENVTLRGTRLPSLGVGIDKDFTLTLNYRMGEWAPNQIEAFIRWLTDVCERIPGSSLALDEEVPREWTDEFARAFHDARHRLKPST